MPLTKRCVSPIEVSVNRLPLNIRHNELECVANGTLANLVRQLSSLSKHAENIFSELFHEALKIDHKAESLGSRIERINVKVAQLENNCEETALQDLHLRKAFKSSCLIDQQSVSRHTLPAPLADIYSHCEAPPCLDKLNSYRDDGKEGLKFYTDPNYFFELWRQEMLNKDIDHQHHHLKPKKPGKQKAIGDRKRHKPRQAVDHKKKFIEHALMAGEHIQFVPAEYQTPADIYCQNLIKQAEIAHSRPGNLNLPYNSSSQHPYAGGYPSAVGAEAAQLQQALHPRVNYADANAAVLSQSYVSSNGSSRLPPFASTSSSTTTSSDHLSPQSMISLDNNRSGILNRPYRPTQAPPAPPPGTLPYVDGVVGTTIFSKQSAQIYPHQPNGDINVRLDRLNIAAAPVIDANSVIASKSASPELPPPPLPVGFADFNGVCRDSNSPDPPAFPLINDVDMKSSIPPPPLPPPMSLFASSVTVDAALKESVASTGPKPSTSMHDARSDLLKAIRQGIQLKKVEERREQERVEQSASQGHDVAAILMRRVAISQSDSEESDDNFEDDWSD